MTVVWIQNRLYPLNIESSDGRVIFLLEVCDQWCSAVPRLLWNRVQEHSYNSTGRKDNDTLAFISWVMCIEVGILSCTCARLYKNDRNIET